MRRGSVLSGRAQLSTVSSQAAAGYIAHDLEKASIFRLRWLLKWRMVRECCKRHICRSASRAGRALRRGHGSAVCHPHQELIAVRTDLQASAVLARVLRQARLVGPEAITRIPVQRHVLLHPRGLRRTEPIERIMQGFQDTLQAVQGADRR
jgi:hypothetical protein